MTETETCRFCQGTGIRKWVTIRQPFGQGDWVLGKKTGESPCPNGCPEPPDVAQTMRDDLFDMRTLLVVLRQCEGVQTWYEGTSVLAEIDAVLARTDYR